MVQYRSTDRLGCRSGAQRRRPVHTGKEERVGVRAAKVGTFGDGNPQSWDRWEKQTPWNSRSMRVTQPWCKPTEAHLYLYFVESKDPRGVDLTEECVKLEALSRELIVKVRRCRVWRRRVVWRPVVHGAQRRPGNITSQDHL